MLRIIAFAFLLVPVFLALRAMLYTKEMRSAIYPVCIIVLFWLLLAFVNFDFSDWRFAVKRSLYAFSLLAFISSIYYLLSKKMVLIETLIWGGFLLMAGYSLVSFIVSYWILGQDYCSRLYPLLKSPAFLKDSLTYVALIMTSYGVVLMSWLLNRGERLKAVALLLVILFFLYFYNSRATMVALAAGLVAMAFVVGVAKNRNILAVLALLSILFIITTYYSECQNLLNRGLSYRVEIMAKGFQKTVNCGIWAGCGLGANSVGITLSNGLTFQPHNLFASHFLETGLFGALSLMGIVLYVVFWGFKTKSKMVLALFTSLTALMFDSSSLFTLPNVTWLVFWLPMTVTYWEINQNKEQHKADATVSE